MTDDATVAVACSLSAGEARQQLSDWRKLAPAVRLVDLHAEGATVWLDSGAEELVLALAEREAACCPFLRFRHSAGSIMHRLDIESEDVAGAEVARSLAEHMAGTSTALATACDCC
jgi:hypothetical protein